MIQVVNRALNILEMIAANPGESLTLSEIADSLNLNHGTCANILKTLVNRNYVEQIGVKKGYKLGYMTFQLTDPHAYHSELKKIAVPFIDMLRDTINETVILSIIEGGRRILLYQAECNQEIQVRTNTSSSAYKATTGRQLLSHYPPQELDFFIKKNGLPDQKDWPGIRSKDDLIKALGEIKRKDVEISLNTNHVVSLAALIFRDGTAIASLGIYLPDIRFDKEKRTILSSEIIKTAHEINRAIEDAHRNNASF
jgi:hypothetical protein